MVVIPRDRIDPKTDMVRIWGIHEDDWMFRAPVDAAEAIKLGSALLDKPEPKPEPEPEKPKVVDMKKFNRAKAKGKKPVESDKVEE